jgi:O-antigen/teichoic acid export membrane protein
MLLKHSFAYFFARGLPGLVNFAALVLYTRLLAPEQYGQYALVIAIVSMVGVIVFQWLRLVVGRWWPKEQSDPKVFLGRSLAIFLVLSVAAIAISLLAAMLWPDRSWSWMIGFAGFLLVSQQWLELNLMLATMELAPTRYAKLLGVKSVLALAIGGTLSWAGWGAWGPLLGLFVGSSIVVPIFCSHVWRGARVRQTPRHQLAEQLRYGLPLVVTFALGWIIASSDRLLIGWLMNVDAAGLYAAGYDLAQQGVGLLLATVQVAAYPLAVRAMENEGAAAAQRQMKMSGEMIAFLACSAAGALCAIPGPIAEVVVGPEFRSSTAELLPIVGIAAALIGLKAFHFDMAFHLERNSRPLVASAATAAVLNVVLNMLAIPRFGLLGAAYATVVAVGVGLILSAWWGRFLPQMPAVWPLVIKASAFFTVAYICCFLIGVLPVAAIWLCLMSATTSAVVCGCSAWCFDIGGVRHALRTALIGRFFAGP